MRMTKRWSGALWTAGGVLAAFWLAAPGSAQDERTEPPPAPGAEQEEEAAPPPAPRPDGGDDPFIPSEEIGADEEVTFPVDI